MSSGRNLRAEFGRRGPWVTRYRIAGEFYGGEFDAQNDVRLAQFWEAFPRARTILELGSLEGGHTFALAAHPAVERVVGIEGRQDNVDKARWVGGLLEAPNVEFIHANLESTPLQAFGCFDAVFCCGLLYHLPRPWALIDNIAQVSDNLFLSTHYAAETQVNAVRNGIRGLVYYEYGLIDPLSGMSNDSFWPTLEGLLRSLRKRGLDDIRIIQDIADHPHGPTITLAACRR